MDGSIKSTGNIAEHEESEVPTVVSTTDSTRQNETPTSSPAEDAETAGQPRTNTSSHVLNRAAMDGEFVADPTSLATSSTQVPLSSGNETRSKSLSSFSGVETVLSDIKDVLDKIHYELSDRDVSTKIIEPTSQLPGAVEEQTTDIVHTIDILNLDGDCVYTKPYEKGNRNIIEEEKPQNSALEIVNRYMTSVDNTPKHGKMPPVRYKLDNRIIIHSRAILKALNTVCDYYPGQSIEGTRLVVREPFEVLVHNQEELAKYAEKFTDDFCSRPDICEHEKDTRKHLLLLQNTLTELIGPPIRLERERHARPTPMCSFKYVWLLFKPGTDVYFDKASDGVLHAGVVKSCTKISTWKFWVTVWYLEYDGEKMGRVERTISIYQFDGDKEIRKLEVFPSRILDDMDTKAGRKPFRELLVDYGKLYYHLTSRTVMDYAGPTLTWPKRWYESKVMVDTESAYKDEYDRPGFLEADNERFVGFNDCFCPVCIKSQDRNSDIPAKFADYDDIWPLLREKLTNHQYFLCTREVPAFVFRVRSWQKLDIAYFSEPKFNTSIIDTLVMKESLKSMIKALTISYTQSSSSPEHFKGPWAADFVAGKGEGLLFLLHGSPGVGKTYTAECVAEYTKTPLLSLSASNLGTDPDSIDQSLTKYFKLAKLWGVVLLLDEADVYLEQRTTVNLERNTLVAIFLQAMEYYQGIMFLTTNRIGTFDDAFTSRIHISVHFPKLTEEDRKQIWYNFFAKLERERGKTIRVPIEAKDYATRGRDVRLVEWNGREIRNAFQTAVALAEYSNERDEEGKVLLKEKHLMEVVEVSRTFKDYLKTMHHADESKRAEKQGVRYDEYTARDEAY